MNTDLTAALTAATAYFCAQEDGEDRESMAGFWCDVAQCAALGPQSIQVYLGLLAIRDAAIADENLAAEDAANTNIAEYLGSL